MDSHRFSRQHAMQQEIKKKCQMISRCKKGGGNPKSFTFAVTRGCGGGIFENPWTYFGLYFGPMYAK
jgi:hypothetical protein